MGLTLSTDAGSADPSEGGAPNEADPKPQEVQLLFQLAGGLRAKSIRGLLEALVPSSGPLTVGQLAGSGEAWITRTPGNQRLPVTVMAHGLGSDGMASAPSKLLMAAIMAAVMALLFGAPAIPLGQFLGGLVGCHPESWPRLKHASMGLGPFLPFAARGAMAFIGTLFVYWTSRVIGWVILTLLRRRPQARNTQTATLVGLGVVAVMLGIILALKAVLVR